MTVISQNPHTIATKEFEALSQLKHYYLNDDRPFCVAYSGGKDSTAVLYLVIKMLNDLKKQKQSLEKKVYVINSNTLAELPPILKHLKETLEKIQLIAKEKNLPLIVKEVFPELINTLNVQLIGVGMPPPSSTFRWCTDKLKVTPIDYELKRNFPEGKFISIIGTRKDESFDRAQRMEKASVKGTNLKLNDRYINASNLMPIEHWSTKDVWEYLFEQNNDLVDIQFLWKLYSDASSKDASECSFVGAGGKSIEEGSIGCGVSRFGCWQCYMVRDNDKSLDGLLKSGYENIHLYKEYRDWYWNISQQGWEITRDVYSHKYQNRELYNKGGEENPKFGMTMPRGIRLSIRKQSLQKILELQSKLDETIITVEEIIEIQKRWLMEGDLELSAFKEAKKHHIHVRSSNLPSELRKQLKEAKKLYREKLSTKTIKKDFSILTLKRFAIQQMVNPKTIERKFFPSKLEEKHIRKEWKNDLKITSKDGYINLLNFIPTLNVKV
ncbi:MAG: phosphoadenosine phosphosulfate reductase family protein [Sulfuricurvum sp.]|nr:phosphoadenosine phosphosulfate reductase family protein [Sulfuricurvum sp.]